MDIGNNGLSATQRQRLCLSSDTFEGLLVTSLFILVIFNCNYIYHKVRANIPREVSKESATDNLEKYSQQTQR